MKLESISNLACCLLTSLIALADVNMSDNNKIIWKKENQKKKRTKENQKRRRSQGSSFSFSSKQSFFFSFFFNYLISFDFYFLPLSVLIFFLTFFFIKWHKLERKDTNRSSSHFSKHSISLDSPEKSHENLSPTLARGDSQARI